MSLGIKALFYKKKDDETAKYEVEIRGVVNLWGMIDELEFKQVYLNDGYVDFMLDITKEDIDKIIFGYYGKDMHDNMMMQNQELLSVLFEVDNCERICLWIYEYD